MKVLAAIFDLDGTIVDSENIWAKAYLDVLASMGVNPENSHPEITGASIKDNWLALISKYNLKTTRTLDELETLTFLEFQKYIPKIYLREGAVELIMNLKEAGIEIALATSSNWETADKILKNLNIEGLFDNITTGEEVINQKPDPEIFLKAAEKLNLEPDLCLVFEDSAPGVEAAKDAGMKVIAIDPTGEKSDLENAELIVGEFSEVTPKVVDQL